ncbi:MAG: hypothetical protein FWH14_06260 [Oscillospiraceae bacterium]|nr:hypothetical protein [Oscillospiraceae bacterium]
MANTRNKVAIVFDGVVCRDDRPRSSVVTANYVCLLGSPFGRAVGGNAD